MPKLKKFNTMTKKYHISLPFLDQVLERVARYKYPNGHLDYFHISIALEDKEKINIFICTSLRDICP